jgi:hypothetical protein
MALVPLEEAEETRDLPFCHMSAQQDALYVPRNRWTEDTRSVGALILDRAS